MIISLLIGSPHATPIVNGPSRHERGGETVTGGNGAIITASAAKSRRAARQMHEAVLKPYVHTLNSNQHHF